MIYYVTNHGYGHGVRTSAIVNALPDTARVILRTALPEGFFREELRREFGWAPAAFDCGCIQADGIRSDIGATLTAYRDIAERNRRLFDEEVSWCRSRDPSVIVSDIVPFAFEVAHRCGIPSVAAANFTWYDIYEPYCGEQPSFRPLLDELKTQYASASLLLSLDPALPMPYFPRRISIGPVGRQGRNRRAEIVRHYGLDGDKHLALLYVGQLGIEGLDLGGIGRFTDWEFLGVSPLAVSPANYRGIEKADFPYEDLAASVDCMVGKLGYGAVVEAMLHGTPMIYLPREDFTEFRALESAVGQWGGGTRLTRDEFTRCEWTDALAGTVARARPPRVRSDGAKRAAACIMKLAGG